MKILPYIIAGLCAYIAGLHIYISQKKCPEIVKTITKIDTAYISSSPVVIKSKPVNTIQYKTITRVEKGETIIDTLFQFVNDCDMTYSSVDTLRNDSVWVAINDNGDCFGIQDRTAIWGGKEKVITHTITNNIATPPQVFTLYGGVSNQIYNKQIKDVTPNAMLVYKNKFGVEYGYGVLQKSHNIGLKFKIK
jgi:hypothetical protein